MISKLSLKNFKTFSSLKDLKLAPITILSGVNSSGKSSILHSLLLLKQSIEGELPEEAVQLDGKYLQYSQLRELSYGLPRESVASIGYTVSIDDAEGCVGYLSFEIRHKELPDNPKRKGTAVTNFSWKGVGDQKESKICLRKNIYKKPASVKTEGPMVPKGYSLNVIEENVKFENFLPSFIEKKMEVREPNSEKKKVIGFKFPLQVSPTSLSGLVDSLSDDLKRMKYLGPSRALPRRAYIHYSEKHHDLDDDGGNAAHILWLRQKEEVEWKGKQVPLMQATSECLAIMGLTQDVTPSCSSRIVYQLLLGTHYDPKKKVTIADVGFGYSQLLPIILRGLLSEKNALLLFEQPEIHLHPSAASKLADLFITFMESGRRIIVETHSTELINKLQLHVIQDNSLANKINVVFVSPCSGVPCDGVSVKQLSLRKDGMFDDWPSGFCDESEKLARAIIMSNAKR